MKQSLSPDERDRRRASTLGIANDNINRVRTHLHEFDTARQRIEQRGIRVRRCNWNHQLYVVEDVVYLYWYDVVEYARRLK